MSKQMDRAQSEQKLAERVGGVVTLPIADQIGNLAETFKRYAAHAARCPFNIEDIVTPRADSNISTAGLPHIVLEVIDETEPLWMAGGSIPNIRLGNWTADHMHTFWTESWTCEWFNGQTEIEEA